MEETFLRVKLERDELMRQKNRDAIDGGVKIETVNDEIANLKTELKRQKAHYEAQFIEYVSRIIGDRMRGLLNELRNFWCILRK